MTAHYCKYRPLYLISIPKAGTHLLFRLARALGFVAGGVAPEQPKGNHWYYLLYGNAHTTTREFFRDELKRAPFGNRTHAFMRSPALFNYRNPLDILVSEANYWHIDGNSPLSVLLGHPSFEQRLARLVQMARVPSPRTKRRRPLSDWRDRDRGSLIMLSKHLGTSHLQIAVEVRSRYRELRHKQQHLKMRGEHCGGRA